MVGSRAYPIPNPESGKPGLVRGAGFQGVTGLARFRDRDFDGNARAFGLAFAIGPDGALAKPFRDSDGLNLGFPFGPQAAPSTACLAIEPAILASPSDPLSLGE